MNTILTTQCADDVGLIAKITGLCHEHNLNITRNNEFVDKDAKRFFMRTELSDQPNTDFITE
uniref:ACT domain-containing protein n=1 Tax=Streptomyces turgidiscabies TaxID=85558 RepID=UPI0038F65609